MTKKCWAELWVAGLVMALRATVWTRGFFATWNQSKSCDWAMAVELDFHCQLDKSDRAVDKHPQISPIG